MGEDKHRKAELNGHATDSRGRRRRPNAIKVKQWSAFPVDMLRSHAWRVMTLAAKDVVFRLCIELADHGGTDNGKLPVTKEDFIEYGVGKNSVAPGIREAQALGFIEVTVPGRAGNAEDRTPNLFRVTFLNCRNMDPTHEWKRIHNRKQAEAIAKEARKPTRPGPRPKRNGVKFPVPNSGTEAVPNSGTESQKFPVPNSGTTPRPDSGTSVYILPGVGGREHGRARPAWATALLEGL